MLPRLGPFALLLLALTPACQNYRDQLDRADLHYRAAEYEAALSNLDDLTTDLGRLDAPDRLRYEYIRGMTAARLSQRVEARHWLAIAREEIPANPHVLTEEMQTLLARTLAEIDPVADPDFGSLPAEGSVHGAGVTAMPGSGARR